MSKDTPLCPAGHLPHKEGDHQDALPPHYIDRHIGSDDQTWESGNFGIGLKRWLRFNPISPLVAEMPGRAEGGISRHNRIESGIFASGVSP
ncbi:hypothetical protein FHP24_16435 [Aliirhizobium smilacinae]|uniref:Lytic murein transglycosylase n=1 Tax=Aliirhizobium smilacinae TaxID=1395944 RepID=A0A5C4XIU3_9HYPH|nr:hypothetical protein FHP24_16435 [Rhizobium smilacinae]